MSINVVHVGVNEQPDFRHQFRRCVDQANKLLIPVAVVDRQGCEPGTGDRMYRPLTAHEPVWNSALLDVATICTTFDARACAASGAPQRCYAGNFVR